ncbi:MAG: hypothetical protein JJU10_11135 [Idiomarina sp.]|nr:hypothetical protein [Idiomarina sp.]
MSAPVRKKYVKNSNQGMKASHKYFLNIGIGFIVCVVGFVSIENMRYPHEDYELYVTMTILGLFYLIASIFLGLVNLVVRPLIRYLQLSSRKKKAYQEARLCQSLYDAGFLDDDCYETKKVELKPYIMTKTI